jgi:hypothetical protein
MIDPITAFTAASAAFRGVQTLVNHGRDIEEVFGQLAKWAGHVSDVQEWMGQTSKPSIFKKLTFQDDTKAALEAVMYRNKIAAMEKEIREMFQWYGPPGAYEEFIKERRRIKAHREKTIYEQQRRRRAFVHNSILISLIVLISITIVSLIGLAMS